MRDDEHVTHLSNKDGEFTNCPRAGREDEVSVRRGRLSLADMLTLIGNPLAVPGAPGALLPPGGRIRVASVRRLRREGFAVIHTPGKDQEAGTHVSVMWPATDPLTSRQAVWPAEVQALFAACFTLV
jgi:hypothetical protein